MMRSPPQKSSVLDSRLARILALIVALSALTLMGWLGREDVSFVRGLVSGVTGQTTTQTVIAGNPKLDACLGQRVGDVENMRADGIVNEVQYKAFKSRAISYCQAQFPGQR